MSNRKILLISEDKVKSETSLNDNAFGKYLLPAIKVAQDINLQEIIGSCLYHKLQDLIAEETIGDEENMQYKDLLDNYIADYLCFQVLANVTVEFGTKLGNIGVVHSNDEYVSNLSDGERDLILHQYQNYADSYCKHLQSFLKANRDAFPELNCGCICDGDIKPHLDSSASSDIWLGGLRGKRL